MKTLLTALFFLSISLSAQDFVIPESAAYDSKENRILISNYADGNIIQIDSTGKKSYFKKGLSKSLGMIINKNTLYVVNDNKYVVGIKLSDASIIFKVEIKEALFLNDITTDNQGSLYVTDSNLNAVFKIDIESQHYELLLKTELDNPNGIVFDEINNRLVFCYFRENSPISGIDLKNPELKTIVETEYDNLDGIALDDEGNFYISSWQAGSFKSGFSNNGIIYKFDNHFTIDAEIIQTEHRGPADIYFDCKNKRLIIPLFLENDVQILDLLSRDQQ